MKPSHSLNNYLDLGVVKNYVKVLYKEPFVRIAGKVLEVENIFYFELRLGALAHDAVVVFVYDLGNAAAHNAVAHYGNVHSSCLSSEITIDIILSQRKRLIKSQDKIFYFFVKDFAI